MAELRERTERLERERGRGATGEDRQLLIQALADAVVAGAADESGG
jgi:hypothetical protein